MKVTKVSAGAQDSKGAVQSTARNRLYPGRRSAWERGAGATIDASEDRREAHKRLYADLAAQLKELFTNGPHKPQDNPGASQKVEDETPREERRGLVLAQDEGRLVSRGGPAQKSP